MRYVIMMARIFTLAILPFALLTSSCSPVDSSTECKGLSKSKAVALAVKQKRGMLSRSVQTERDNFASDDAKVASDNTGYVAKVGFKGRDGRTLIALIDEDCYVGWTKGDLN